jgi:hypothetical protein
VALDSVLYLLLALCAFVLICVPNVLGYRSSSATSFAARVVSFAGFLLLVVGSLLAASCVLGDCLGLGAAADTVASYLWFYAPGVLFSLLGWALALVATNRHTDNRRFSVILLAPSAMLLAALIVDGIAALSGANGAGAWIATAAYITPCLPLCILLAVPKDRA